MAKRRAVVVAINDYGSPRNNLESCVADAGAMADKLRTEYGFEEVTTLLDGDATIKNVDSALTALFTNVSPDDRLVFYYSGHGYQTQRGENREEVLVLRDGFYPDDTLAAKTQNLPIGTLTVVLDSCFSGGMEKMFIPAGDSFVVTKIKRWIPDEATIERENAELKKVRKKVRVKTFGAAAARGPQGLAKDFGFGFGPTATPTPTYGYPGGFGVPMPSQPESDEGGQLQMNALLVTACLENETAASDTEQTRGLSAFTCCLLEALRGVPRQQLEWSPSVEEAVGAAAMLLRRFGFRQTPMLKQPRTAYGLSMRSFVLLNPTSPMASQPMPGRPMTFGGMGAQPSWPSAGPQMSFGQPPTPQGYGVQKGFTPGATQPGWGDVVGLLAQIAPHTVPAVVDALQKSSPIGSIGSPVAAQPSGFGSPPFVPNPMGPPSRDWLSELIATVAQTAPHILPLLMGGLPSASPQGYVPGGGGFVPTGFPQPGAGPMGAVSQQKDGFSDLVGIIAQVAPHLLPFVMTGFSRGSATPLAAPTPITSAQVPSGSKEWGDLIGLVAQTAPHALGAIVEAFQRGLQPGLPSIAPAMPMMNGIAR